MTENRRAVLISGCFIISRTVTEALGDNPMFLADHMAHESKVKRDDIDTILVLENGDESPNVVHHYEPHCWSE